MIELRRRREVKESVAKGKSIDHFILLSLYSEVHAILQELPIDLAVEKTNTISVLCLYEMKQQGP